jgi:hypothetical protein
MPADDDVADGFETLRLSHEIHIDSLMPPLSDEEGDDYQQASFTASGSVSDSLSSGAPGRPTWFSSSESSVPDGRSPSWSPPAIAAGKAKTRSISNLSVQPQFNLDNAASLLTSFRAMLTHFPCVALPGDATVASMASVRPFVLLAILAAASGSRTLQGHSLYDEEFRKILALKFVAGGERSMELLQGLVIYCAW